MCRLDSSRGFSVRVSWSRENQHSIIWDPKDMVGGGGTLYHALVAVVMQYSISDIDPLMSEY